MAITDDHFQREAAQRCWSDRTQVAVLLEYIGYQDCDAAFHDFLGEKAKDPEYDAADEFLWEVADRLQHRGLVLDAEFQRFCADCFDLFTPEEAAAEWQRRTAA